MSYRVALFDLDGTVLDTLQDLASSTNAALQSNSLPPRTVEEVRAFVGNGIGKLIERAVPAGSDAATVAAVLESFKTHYKAHCADQTRPYDGIPAMLAALRAAGVKTAVISNKADFAVQELAKRYFDGLFDFALGERADIARKPAPDMIYFALEQMGVAKEEAVYIGDSDVDILTAKNAGLPAIGVTWGFRDRTCLEEAGATLLANTVGELQGFLYSDITEEGLALRVQDANRAK